MEAGSEFLTQLMATIEAVQRFATTLILPSRLLQIAVALALLLVAVILARFTQPRLDAWMHGLEGRPKWQLRLLVTLKRRLVLAWFTVLIWLSVGVFALIYQFPSRRYLLELVATVASIWLFVRFAAQIIQNRFLRQIVVWSASIWVALYYFGLTDATAQLLDSIAIEAGDLRISLLATLKAIVIVAALFAAARLVVSTAAQRLRRNEDLSPSVRELSVKILQIVLYAGAFVLGLKAVGVDLTALAFLSGAIGLGLGFGLQKVVSNLVSGIIILMDKSVKPGDVISLGDTFGWINELSARYVSVVTRDGREYLIPNEDLITNQVVNWSHTDNFVRLDLTFGTSYADDPHLVRKLAVETAQKVPRVLRSKPPVCHITGFGDSSVDYVLRFWIGDPQNGLTNIRGNVFLALWDAFHAAGITIPFPQREVRLLPGSELSVQGDRAASEEPDVSAP